MGPPNQGFSCAPIQCSQPAAPPLAAASCASSISADAASGWRAHAAVPQHFGPLPGGGRSPRAHPATSCRVPWDHPPCRSRCSAAHPMGSLLMGKASACAKKRGPLLSCSFAASESWPRSWSREARPPSGPPGTVLARCVMSVAESRHGPPASESALSRGPAASVPCAASPVPLTWVGLAAFGWKQSEWGKKSQNAGRGLRGDALLLFCSASSPALFCGCYDPLVALQSSRFGAAQALYRLRESTFNLSKVHRGFALPKPAATQAEAVFGVSRARPVSALQPDPCPPWRLLGTVCQWWLLGAALVRGIVGPGLQCCP